jgi:beta-galactosidase
VAGRTPGQRTFQRLDSGWKFNEGDLSGAQAAVFDDAAWEAVTLPHSGRIESLVTGPPGTPGAIWQGLCWYRRTLRLPASATGQNVQLCFEGAMNVADVWLDGERVGGHMGGYLPFVIDLTERLQPDRDHVLAVRLDNRDNPITGPKPQAQLDFNIYHGLYRPVFLITTDKLHITDPLLADRPASGGVFVTYPRASRESATVRVQVHVRNDYADARSVSVRAALAAPDGSSAAAATTVPMMLNPGTDADIAQELEVATPKLWSPASPDLYTLSCEVLTDAGIMDIESLRIGIKRITVSGEGIRINGERMFLRGTNRHQEYPYVGYAMSDAAQYRDAMKIKAAGFDYVRLSHYAHSPAFMDACDELGLVVMDCIPGWQYFNPDPAFIDLQYRNCRDLIRRDRNHPCVILWEVSLNETGMPPAFVARTHAIAHEEYPGDQCFSAGWMHGYDVFLDARQHGGCRHEVNSACLVSEYGDWEYYAMNAGLDQTTWQNLSLPESNSRQLRWQGERAQLQQAANFQEAHNDNLATIAFADGLWVMFDYDRGYAPDIESSGCADIFRLPKYSYHFFRSQRDAAERAPAEAAGPMVFIASDWTATSNPVVRVFSNCDKVALHLNGRLLAEKGPDADRMSNRLAHPPFTFDTGGFRAGVLEAVGTLAGRVACRHVVRTPGAIDHLALAVDRAGRPRDPVGKDVLICHASLCDAHGTVVPDAWENVAFGVTGGATLAGMNPLATDAGISSIVMQTLPATAAAVLYGLALVPSGGTVRILGASLALDAGAPAFRLRFTTDGTDPGPASLLSRDPVPANPRLRAALLVGDRVVASLAADTPKFRVPASAPPDRRDPFRR